MTKISVIVPVYKVEPYLRRCVDSILAQTFTDFELILVDDGSPDNCPAICDEYAAKDRRVRVIHQKNGGVSAARNSALDVAEGEYVTFVDSDDSVSPNRLEVLVQAMIREKADVVISNLTMINENGEIVNEIHHKDIGTFDISQADKRIEHLCLKILSCRLGWEVWTRLFKNDIIKEHNIRFPLTCGNYAEDMGFVLAYTLYSEKIVSIDYSGYIYLMRSDSMMRLSAGKVKLNNLNELSKWLYKYYCEASASDEYFPILHFLMTHTELSKLIKSADTYSKIGDCIRSVEDFSWFRSQNKNMRKCRAKLKQYYGKRVARQIMLFCHYCNHMNWKRYTYESAIAYKWFIK